MPHPDLWNPKIYANGISRLRVVSVDLSPKNTAIGVLEYTDAVRSPDVTAESPWREQAEHVVPKRKLLALFNIDPQNPKRFSAWVHLRVYEDEIKPMAKLREKWTTMMAEDLREFCAKESVFANTDVEPGVFYLKTSILADQHVAACTTLNKDVLLSDQGYVTAMRQFTQQLMRPECIPIFTYLSILLLENQLDQTKYAEYKYQQTGLRDQKLLGLMFEIFRSGRCPSPEVAFELLKRYDRVTGHWRSHAPMPENWLYMLAFVAAVHTVDMTYGRGNTPRIVVLHSRKFALDALLAAETDSLKRNPRARESGRRSKDDEYKDRKMGAITILRYEIALTLELCKGNEDDVKSYTILRDQYLIDSTEKKDNYDAGDVVCLADDWARENLRLKPYTAPERAEIEKASLLFEELMQKAKDLLNMTEETAEKVLLVKPEVVQKPADKLFLSDTEAENTTSTQALEKIRDKKRKTPATPIKLPGAKKAKTTELLDTEKLEIIIFDDLIEDPDSQSLTKKTQGKIEDFLTKPAPQEKKETKKRKAPSDAKTPKPSAKRPKLLSAKSRKELVFYDDDDEEMLDFSARSGGQLDLDLKGRKKTSSSHGGVRKTSDGAGFAFRSIDFDKTAKSVPRAQLERQNTVYDLTDYNDEF